jgi:hypothetical protein
MNDRDHYTASGSSPHLIIYTFDTLKAVLYDVAEIPDGRYSARCPSCQRRTLTVREGRNGTPLIFCASGCHPGAIFRGARVNGRQA